MAFEDGIIKTRITVTQEHINHGRRHRPNSCPIALAVKEQLGTDAWVNGIRIMRAGRAGGWWDFQEYRISATTKQFIEDFDARLVVEPLSFEMEPLFSPEELNRPLWSELREVGRAIDENI